MSYCITNIEVGTKFVSTFVISPKPYSTRDFERETQLLVLAVPNLPRQVCVYKGNRTFADALPNTPLAHLIEHLAIELSIEAGARGIITGATRRLAPEDAGAMRLVAGAGASAPAVASGAGAGAEAEANGSERAAGASGAEAGAGASERAAGAPGAEVNANGSERAAGAPGAEVNASGSERAAGAPGAREPKAINCAGRFGTKESITYKIDLSYENDFVAITALKCSIQLVNALYFEGKFEQSQQGIAQLRTAYFEAAEATRLAAHLI